MNELIALTILLVLSNLVQYGSSERLCAIIRGHPEKSIMLEECFNSNFPAVVTDVYTRCYETSFGSSGSIAKFVDQICAEDKDEEGMQAMGQCVKEEGDKAPVVDREEQRKAGDGTESCFIQKLGLTKEEYDTILQNYRFDDVE